jgi:hypothetical protein
VNSSKQFCVKELNMILMYLTWKQVKSGVFSVSLTLSPVRKIYQTVSYNEFL